MAGSAPPASARWRYDTVAYTGRVPVKLHGSAMYGDVSPQPNFQTSNPACWPVHLAMARCGLLHLVS